MSDTNFYQCMLVHEYHNTRHELTTWVPEKYAIVGKRVTVDDSPTIWTVESVGKLSRTKNEVVLARMADTRWRDKTDV